MEATSHLYLIALGSNKRHNLLGNPEKIIDHAFDALEIEEIDVFLTSSIMQSAPIGPSQRRYANAAALVISALEPPEMLKYLKNIEAHFGRNDIGQRWRSRILDLDIILWSGGCWNNENPALSIPHPEFRKRGFVLKPANEIAPEMRDPISGLTIKQLTFRFLHEKPLDQKAKGA